MSSITFSGHSKAGLLSTGFVAVLIATLVVSWPALDGPFLFDDFPNLKNLAVLSGNLDWQALAHYSAQYNSEPGRPLSMLSFVINDYDWPTDPWGFKYTNLMIHVLIGVLVFGFARSLCHLVAPSRASLTAFLAMAAWLLHPMQLSTSMLVVQRMTQLSALFAIAGLWSYVVLASRAGRSYVASLAIFALGAATVLASLCKETGALTPLLAVVINATLLRRHLQNLPTASRRVLIWGAVLPVIFLLAAIAWRWDSLTNYGSRTFSMADRALTQARVLVNYFYQIVVPNLRGGGIYHDDFVVSYSLWRPWTTFPAIALVSLATGYAIGVHRRYPMFAFAVLWFLGAHLLESTIFPLEIYFEHRNYLPMFGPLFALAFAATARTRWKGLLLALAFVWIAFAGWLTSVQAPIWGDAGKLTAIWSTEHPSSARAMQQRALYLTQLNASEPAANLLLNAYRRGVRGDDFPLQALGIACALQNMALAEEAWPLVNRSIQDAAYDNGLVEVVGRLRVYAERKTCPGILGEDSWLQLTNRLMANPRYGIGGGSRHIHIQRSYLFRHQRDLNLTMRELEAAWAAGPTPDLAQLIAATLASAGLFDEAELWADRALAHRVRGFRGLLSMDDVKSKALQHALRDKQRLPANRENVINGDPSPSAVDK